MNRKLCCALLGGAASLASVPAFAQSEAPKLQPSPSTSIPEPNANPLGQASGSSEQSDGLGDIVVTAQFRRENLQDVPIAASAFSSADLKTKGARQGSDLAQMVPNLQINGSFASVPKITIRGIGTNDFQTFVQAAVGTYIDDVYIGPAVGQNLQLFDIDRVEVLRGPQGTLYGKNTTGGAINYYSALPTAEFGGGGTVSVGDYGRFEADAHVNLPLGAGTRLRLSFMNRDRDGYVRNTLGGPNLGRVNVWGVRGVLTQDLGADWSARLIVSGGKSRSDATPREPVGTFAGGPGDVLGYVDPADPYVGGFDHPLADDVDSFQANLKVEGRLADHLSLTSVTAYGHLKRVANIDNDFSPNSLNNIIYASDQKYYSQELRISFDSDPVRLTGGVHYYRDDSKNNQDFQFFYCEYAASCTPKIPLPPIHIVTTPNPIAYSTAGFLQGDLKVTDRLTITGGLRYTTETRSFDSQSLVLTPNSPFPGFAHAFDQKTWHNLSYKVGVTYNTGDGFLAYANVSTGFRSGNYTHSQFQRLLPNFGRYNPETLTAYEIGIKSTLFDRTLRLNAAIFRMDYKDLQVSTFRNATAITDNAADARIQGAEGELTWQPAQWFKATVGAGYLDAVYKNYISGTGATLSGNTLINAPKFNLTYDVSANVDLSPSLNLYGGIFGKYQTQVFFRPENDLGQGAYHIGNLRVGLHSKDGWDLQFWAKNLFNVVVRTDANAVGAPFYQNLILWNEPRMIGATLSFDF